MVLSAIPIWRWCAMRSKGRRFWIVCLALAACAVAVVVAAGAASATSGKKQATIVVGYSNPAASEPGLRSIYYGMQQAVKKLKLGWSVKQADAGFSSNKQVS